ncbi:MAG TPA: SDR family oxidoreductase [Candidatus Polarisedimenticolia bacterium]|nr:SDR family oxidoreductase [Candidatus Polarisedimenticolia bacterium]
MIWRRWVTESSSSAPQTSSDHLDRRVSNTRMRPSQSGLVQVGIAEVIAGSALELPSSSRITGKPEYCSSESLAPTERADFQFNKKGGVQIRQFNTNVLGTFLMIEATLPVFGAEGGSIINIASTASVAAYPTLSIYVASKSAVNGLTRVLSKEFGPRKIRVNALNPGGTETEGTHAAGVMGTEFKKQIIASTSLGRVGQPEDIARVAVLLASDDAGWLTGETIFANGGHK